MQRSYFFAASFLAIVVAVPHTRGDESACVNTDIVEEVISDEKQIEYLYDVAFENARDTKTNSLDHQVIPILNCVISKNHTFANLLKIGLLRGYNPPNNGVKYTKRVLRLAENGDQHARLVLALSKVFDVLYESNIHVADSDKKIIQDWLSSENPYHHLYAARIFRNMNYAEYFKISDVIYAYVELSKLTREGFPDANHYLSEVKSIMTDKQREFANNVLKSASN